MSALGASGVQADRATSLPARARPLVALARWLARATTPSRSVREARARGRREAFLAAGDAMARRTPPVTLALVSLGDLPEVHVLFGRGAASRVAGAAEAKLRAMAGRRSRVCRTGRALFAVLLPGLDEESAAAALRDAFGKAASIEVDIAGEELVVLASFAIGMLDADREVGEVYRMLADRLAAQARERQRPAVQHRSAPRALVAAAYGTFPATLPATLPATVPATLPMRLR